VVPEIGAWGRARFADGRGRTGSTGKRRRCSAEFEAKLALEALKGDLTGAELVAKRGAPRTLINTWKRQAVEGLSTVFSVRVEAAAADREAELGRLHAKIGELVVERDFSRKGERVRAAGSSAPASGR
jgi:transposase